MNLSFMGELGRYFIRPFQWWFRKDKVSDHISYAMSIEALPNPQGWITGAVISFYCKCDITGNDTSFERIYNFKDSEIIYTKNILDDAEMRAEVGERVQKHINLPIEADFARRTINMQIMVEAAVVWSISLFLVAAGLITAAIGG